MPVNVCSRPVSWISASPETSAVYAHVRASRTQTQPGHLHDVARDRIFPRVRDVVITIPGTPAAKRACRIQEEFSGLEYLDWDTGWKPYKQQSLTAINQIENYMGEMEL